jgi:hypothetical protein
VDIALKALQHGDIGWNVASAAYNLRKILATKNYFAMENKLLQKGH